MQIQVASIFLVGCPACNHNFKHFFCLLTCSPDQAAFANVTAAQTANDTGAANAVAEMDYFVTGGEPGWGRWAWAYQWFRVRWEHQQCSIGGLPPKRICCPTACPLCSSPCSAEFGERFYDSCKDVVYPVMNQKAMAFVGG